MARSYEGLALIGIALGVVSGCAASKPMTPKTAAAHKHVKKAPTADSTPFLSDEDGASVGTASTHDFFMQQSQPRNVEESVPINLDTLPIADLPEAPQQNQTANASWPVELPDSTPTPDGVEIRARTEPGYVDYGSPYQAMSIHFDKFVVADVRLAGTQWPGGAINGDPLLYCGPKSGYTGSYYGYRVAPAHFEGIERRGSDLLYTVIDGWVDSQTCRVRFDHKTSATIGEIIPGLLYGYRSCTHPAPVVQGTSIPTVVDPYADLKIPCTEPNRLNLFFPRTTALAASGSPPNPNQGQTIVTRASLPIRQGTSESLTAAIPVDQMSIWTGALGITGESATTNGHIVELGVEIQQSSRDDQPLAVAYMGSTDIDPRTSRFRPKKRSSSPVGF